MKRVLIIGCPGAGKSTFGRKLATITGLPLIYLDMIWHRADRTNIGRDALVEKLADIMKGECWIIDGNYISTLPMRLELCDTVFFFDLPVDVCLDGAIERLGKAREDMPWSDTSLDEEFRDWILNFDRDQRPAIESMISSGEFGTIVFHSRKEADLYLENFKH